MPRLENLLERLQREYYSNLFLCLVEVVALTVGFLFARKYRIGRYFIFYISFELSILLADFYLYSISGNIITPFEHFFINLTNALISLVELLVYYYFFSKVIANKKIIIVMKILASFFALVMIIFITTKFRFLTYRYGYISDLIGTTEFIFLLPPCLIFYFDLLNNPSDIKLLQRPSFWITTGIFSFSALSIPYFLLNRFMIQNNYGINDLLGVILFNVPFSLNFVFLIKAFLCKKKLTI